MDTHKQYIQVDIILNYIFHFGLPEKCLYVSPRNVHFPNCSKEMFLEVRNETCSPRARPKGVLSACMSLISSLLLTSLGPEQARLFFDTQKAVSLGRIRGLCTKGALAACVVISAIFNSYAAAPTIPTSVECLSLVL